jgi:hypothetical protein
MSIIQNVTENFLKHIHSYNRYIGIPIGIENPLSRWSRTLHWRCRNIQTKSRWKYRKVRLFAILCGEICSLVNKVIGAAASKPPHYKEAPLMRVGATPHQVAPGQGGLLLALGISYHLLTRCSEEAKIP